MVTYTVNVITVLIGDVPKIWGWPDFNSLWGLKQYLINKLKKIEKTDHPNNDHSSYIMPANEYALVSLQGYAEPVDVGEYFEISKEAHTDTAHKIKERKWDVAKGKCDTFCNMQTVLTSVLEDMIGDP